MKTEEINLYETGQAPTVKNVKVGDKIRCIEKNEDEEEKRVTWMVRQVYPFFVYATSRRRHKCFSYGDLVCLGLEDKYTANYTQQGGKKT